MAIYLGKYGKRSGGERSFIHSKGGLSFCDGELAAIVGENWAIEQLPTWQGKEYEMLSECRYRWLISNAGTEGEYNVEASGFVGHDVFGHALMCMDDEIDFSWIDIKGHTYADRETDD